MNNLIDEMYEEWVDELMTIPLVQRGGRRNTDIERALVVNNQIITSMSNIRRHLEIGTNFNLDDHILQTFFHTLFEPEGEESQYEFEDVKVTLTEEDFDRFQTCCVRATDELGYKDCSICIEEFREDDLITELPCKHIFHKSCIKNWLCREKVTCPSCRKDTRC